MNYKVIYYYCPQILKKIIIVCHHGFTISTAGKRTKGVKIYHLLSRRDALLSTQEAAPTLESWHSGLWKSLSLWNQTKVVWAVSGYFLVIYLERIFPEFFCRSLNFFIRFWYKASNYSHSNPEKYSIHWSDRLNTSFWVLTTMVLVKKWVSI